MTDFLEKFDTDLAKHPIVEVQAIRNLVELIGERYGDDHERSRIRLTNIDGNFPEWTIPVNVKIHQILYVIDRQLKHRRAVN